MIDFEKLYEVDNFLSTEWEYEKYGFDRSGELIPYLSLPQEWEIMIIPPFRMAMVRFIVRLKDNPDISVSVYLDGHNQLGYYGEPYWEVYPVGNDVGRCGMKESKKLLKLISKSFKQQQKGEK